MLDVKKTDDQNHGGMKLQDMKQTDQVAGHEIAGRKNTGHENIYKSLFTTWVANRQTDKDKQKIIQ